jgi:hypothetical protein
MTWFLHQLTTHVSSMDLLPYTRADQLFKGMDELKQMECPILPFGPGEEGAGSIIRKYSRVAC